MLQVMVGASEGQQALAATSSGGDGDDNDNGTLLEPSQQPAQQGFIHQLSQRNLPQQQQQQQD